MRGRVPSLGSGADSARHGLRLVLRIAELVLAAGPRCGERGWPPEAGGAGG